MVIVLLHRVTFQASYKGSHFEIGITTDMSMRNTISEPTNQTKVSLAESHHMRVKFVVGSFLCFKGLPQLDSSLHIKKFQILI